ncbi:SLBB domain-containing protein [Piscinibacter koreensis]|uniref:SLBB domain-containing protein n=1 Tax=Piscinibacter koreensis TaxID=2742824 RepID=A0A7Y6TUM0_9BURK|nr:SLBB domain-containing protein [Schlegelella koreensis]NUZ04174.1 SLBB domain-containing protein [Schlegelella koreensis]
MTLSRLRSKIVLAACLLAGPAWAQVGLPVDGGSTFSTPAYPPRTAPAGVPGTIGAMPLPAPPGSTGYPNAAPANPLVQRPNTTAAQQPPFVVVQPAPLDDGQRRPADQTPPRPSEFQRFVEASTGRLLPIFGSTFFADPERLRSLENVPVSADYTVGPGDEVVIRAWGSIDIDYRATVDRNGMLNLPKVGSFNVAGVKASDLERNLRAQIGRIFTNFDLSVSLGQLRGLRVFIVGPAQRPGVVTLPSQSTLLSAVVAAGGPSPTGSMRKVQLRRNDRVISELDVYEFLVQGDKSRDVQLAAGDVVVFQPVGPQVALTGSTDTPAIFELKSAQEPLRDVLRYAGGVPVLANPNRVQLERVDNRQRNAARFVETFSLDTAGLQKPLRDGDVLTLLAISPQFANAVTLRGHVAQPLRYPFTPGMRVRDLIPDRDALITPDFYRRKNMLVQIIEDEEFADTELLPAPFDAAGNPVDPRNPTSGTSTRNQPANGANAANATAAPNLAANTLPIATPGRPLSYTQRVARAEARAARDRARQPAALFEELNWDYAVIERLNRDTLQTEIIPFNLGRAVLQGDEASNVPLQPGDVVTVFSQKDLRVPVARQTRLVSLEGEVNAPGVYQLLPGETLKSLIARAGGFTSQAYVYGLEFSREQTRVRQRENLVTAIARLESLAAIQAAREAANRRDDANAAAATAVSNAATNAQIARLSRVQPNGRVALELRPETRSIDELPDVLLEGSDRISVPPRPGFVTVAGAVVNNNAFLWKPERTAGDYLRLAGADEAADTSNMFILRADGTVTHAGDRRGFFGRGGIEGLRMYPGDALIVPNQLDYETWGRALMRNLKDISQIFAQFGLGIAALNSL